MSHRLRSCRCDFTVQASLHVSLAEIMIDVRRPSETIDYLLSLPAETATIEFKRVSAGGFDKISQCICAFANTDGGWMVLGLGDPPMRYEATVPAATRLFGVEENPAAVDEWKHKLQTRFYPAIPLAFHTLPCTLRDGRVGHLCLIEVPASERVHSIINGGTWTRGGASNRQLTAEETASLALRRGELSAESDLVPVPLDLLNTAIWATFVKSRGPRPGSFEDQLHRIGLADFVEGASGRELRPRRAAVLLFAEEPGSLLAAHGSRADIRIMVYSGKLVASGDLPNLKKEPRTLRGPIIELIDKAVREVVAELAEELVLEGSGFKTRHKYPPRVVTEAIVNAVIHRDYRLNRDIVIRILDDRIIVESPGAFPGRITSSNIKTARSNPRNSVIAANLREFPGHPNHDDGEGVRTMFRDMEAARLYPPQYRELTETAVELIELTLLNEERPEAWAEVSDWMDRNGPIANAEVCRIANVDTLRASRMLKGWVNLGLLQLLEGRGRKNAAYEKPTSDRPLETPISK